MIECDLHFPTPFWRVNIKETIEKAGITFEELENASYEIKKIQEIELLQSGRNSYQSGDLIFEKTPIEIQKTIALISHLVNSIYTQYWQKELVLLNTWLNINSKGSYNLLHTHPNSILSGVFYIKTCKDHPPFIIDDHTNNKFLKESLGFQKDYKQDNPILNTNYQYQAINGFAFIFPSYMPHRVEENKIDIDRISLSFNYGFLR